MQLPGQQHGDGIQMVARAAGGGVHGSREPAGPPLAPLQGPGGGAAAEPAVGRRGNAVVPRSMHSQRGGSGGGCSGAWTRTVVRTCPFTVVPKDSCNTSVETDGLNVYIRLLQECMRIQRNYDAHYHMTLENLIVSCQVGPGCPTLLWNP